MKRTRVHLLFCFLLYSYSIACHGQQAAAVSKEDQLIHKQFIAWLKKASQPLTSTSAGNGFTDLKLFEQSIAGADIVALGEATHGTHEFFTMKHRLVEFLVSKLGYTVFAIEASSARCQYINDYVLLGKGNLDTAVVMQGFPTWRTQEVKELIGWLRTYNSRQPTEKKVQFVGFDVQINDVGTSIVSTFCRTVMPEKASAVDSLMEQVRRVEKRHGVYGGDTSIIGVVPKVQDLLMLFTMNQARFTEKTSVASYEEAWHHLRLMLQYSFAYSRQPFDWRDYYMAENVQFIRSRLPKGTKLILWAHNDHVAKDYQYEPIRSLGYYLKQAYGDRYVAIGFAFYQGKFQSNDPDIKNSPDWEEHEVPPAPVEDLGWFYNQTNYQACYTFWRDVKFNDAVEQWLAKRPVSLYSIGGLFSNKHPLDNYRAYPDLRERFDGMIYIKTSTRAQPLPNMVLSTSK